MTISTLFTGERLVVLLFITRILFSSFPIALIFYQSISVVFLALSSLFIEIIVDTNPSSTKFSTRKGASSGILLGTITLPSVFLSRLIQLQRNQHAGDDIVSQRTYLELQYWVASVSSFAILVYIYNFELHRLVSKVRNFRSLVFNLGVGLMLCMLGCVLSLCLSMVHVGVRVGIMVLWMLCYGYVAVEGMKYVLEKFPFCASMGEAILVTVGVVLYVGDMVGFTVEKCVSEGYYGGEKSEISVVIQGIVIGLLVFPFLYKFLLRIWGVPSLLGRENKGNDMLNGGIGKAAVFYGSLVVILLVIVPAWMQFVMDFEMHPVLWVLNFVVAEPLKRITLCLYWIGVISVSVLRFYSISKNSKIERILLRKYYHLIAVLMFVPALIFQTSFLDLAFGAALAVFLLLEIIRVWNIWPLGKLVDKFMNAFTDHRDSDILIVSHFSLLLGCALPKWMSTGFNDRPLAPFAGILSLGIGDTMASMVGYKYGVLRWSKSGKKTVEGTAAGITSVLAACSALLPLFASTGFILSQQWLSLLFAVTVSGLLEAYTAQLDNAFIPLVFYSLLCL